MWREPLFASTPAALHNRVYIVDGSAYFNRPGPRLVDGLEIIAHVFHPDRQPLPTALPAPDAVAAFDVATTPSPVRSGFSTSRDSKDRPCRPASSRVAARRVGGRGCRSPSRRRAAAALVGRRRVAQVKPLIADASDPFFEKIEIPNVRLTVSEKQLDKLRAEPRTYVKMKLVENDETTHDDVAVKLKGAAGSFRDWDDRPALTLNMKKFNKKGEFHGLAKFHLNNSVQDETYLNEWLSSISFAAPAFPRRV